MEVICLQNDEADQWFAEQAVPLEPVPDPRMHLVLGDSVARRSGLRSAKDSTCNRACEGATWLTVLSNLETDISAWQVAAAANGERLGSALIWLNGAELYTRYTQMSSFSAEELSSIGERATRVIGRLLNVAENVCVLGPLPRPAGELLGTPWQITAAYHHERTLMRIDFGDRLKCLPIGRSLVRKMGRHERGIWGVEHFFLDGVHPSPSGYVKLTASDYFPKWLKVGDE
ncbi:hypothetical protein FJT64_012440 [Amphibalanus amphitrite]|uniref:SGNH/GDSL hydrolase family protein n=1 Tax=Amphibalanus amphitrite TaxID=1232801 RepID=A0A6A4V699_AMPAM|nr:hypothetical protein FJT64_012440 [Amphibalanus amphitrite]